MNPATGGTLLLGLGLEQEYNVPGGTGIIGYHTRLPVKASLDGTEAPSGAVNQSGFIEQGIPGVKGGPFNWPLPMRAGELLEFLEHVVDGTVTKTVLEVGVYKYEFEPGIPGSGPDTSFYCLLTKRPVEAWWLYGIKLSSIEGDIGDNEEIPVSMSGFVGHGTRLGAAVPDEANTGTYALGPFIRGVLKNRAAGDVHVKVTQVAPTLQFKVEQTAGVPAFAGAAVSVVLDAQTGRGTWQNLQGHTGLDLGLWDENKDPLEIVWPGLPADHADLDVGDTFVFPVTWADPAVPFLSGHQRFTSAHWALRLRAVGAADWIVTAVNSGKFSVARAVTPERGSNSRYPYAMTRDGILTPEVELQRKLVSAFFIDRAEAHVRLEGQLAFEGRQLGTGQYRESLVLDYPNLRVDSDERDAASEKAIPEKVKLTGTTNDAGDPPVTITVITSRNWTPTPV